MQPEQESDQKGVSPVQYSPPVHASHGGADSVTSVELETTSEDPETRAVVRRLLWKLDTRCVFFSVYKKHT